MFFENSKIPFLVKFSHKRSPLFSTDFQFSTRMLIFRKQTRKQKIFLAFPSLKYLDFYDVSKNSEHINTFRGARLTKSPSQIPKFNFLEQKESQRPKRKSFQTFSIMANWNLLPKSHREKDNLIINLFKPFKDTISKTNTCFRQHHDNVVSKKTFQRKDSVTVIKTQNHTTRQNSWSYVTIRELQARKHNQFSAMKRLWRKTKFRKDKHFMISKSRYLSFLETKICFQNSQPLKTTQRSWNFKKIVKKEVTGH